MDLKKLFTPTDMTEGVPYKQIASFAIPMLIGNIAQQLYNTVDSIVVGQTIGDNALAAVGSAGPIFNMLLVLFIGISVGAGILVSQYFGAKERENLSFVIGNCITLTFIASIIIMAVTPFVIMPILELLKTPESIIYWCNDYLFVMMMGVIGLAYYNILSGILRGLGDSISALVYLLISTVINIVLDIYFVTELNLGVAGVAYATVIAQSVSAILCFYKLTKLADVFDLKKSHLKINKKHTGDIIRLGIPSGLTQAIFSLAMVVIQSLSNSYGEMFISANVIVMRVDGFAIMPILSFGNALTTFTGQNLGAKKYDRIKIGAKQGTLMCVVVSLGITVALLVFGPILIRLFTKTPDLIDLSMKILYILSPAYVSLAIIQCLFGVMRGAGDTVTPMYLSIITTILIRVPLAYIIAFFTMSATHPTGRYESVHLSLAVSWTIGAIIAYYSYRKGKWRKVLEEQNI